MNIESLHVVLDSKLSLILVLNSIRKLRLVKLHCESNQTATITHEVFEIWNIRTALVLMLMPCTRRFIATLQLLLNKRNKGLALEELGKLGTVSGRTVDNNVVPTAVLQAASEMNYSYSSSHQDLWIRTRHAQRKVRVAKIQREGNKLRCKISC